MAKFYLNKFKISRVSAKVLVWLLISLIIVEMSKDLVVDLVRKSLIDFLFAKSASDKKLVKDLNEKFSLYLRILDFLKLPLPFVVAVYIVILF